MNPYFFDAPSGIISLEISGLGSGDSVSWDLIRIFKV